MKKSTCIVTMPRTGSELLINHLAPGLGLKNIDEFLCNSVRATTRHDKDFNIVQIDSSKFTLQNMIDFSIKDLDSRLEAIRNAEPIVMKFFVSSSYFRYVPNIIEKMHEDMNLIFLSRRSFMKSILSQYICEQIRIWHVKNPKEVENTKEVLENFRANPIEFPEDQFIARLREFNVLHILMNSFVKNNFDCQTIFYEDYAEDTTRILNAKFNMNLKPNQVGQTFGFIEGHEEFFSNIERLKVLKRQNEL